MGDVRDELNRLADRLDHLVGYDAEESYEIGAIMRDLRALSARAAVPFPVADEDAKKLGWMWHYEWLLSLYKEAHQAGQIITMEGIDFVLTKIAAAPQPAGEAFTGERVEKIDGEPRIVRRDRGAFVSSVPVLEPAPSAHAEGCGALCINACNGGPCRLAQESPPSAPADVEALIKHHEMWANDARESGFDDATTFHLGCIETIRRLSGAQQAGADERIACDVRVAPGTTFRAGVQLSTVIMGIRQRAQWDGGPFSFPRREQCCMCGKRFDAREREEGGGPEGAQLTDGRWTCTPTCWELACAQQAGDGKGGNNA